MTNLQKFFPLIDEAKLEQLNQLIFQIKKWNQKINLVSRKDIDNLEAHHLIHSLSMTRVCQFANDVTVLDLGTGGGLPGLPLAICFPHTHFFLIDSIKKKIDAVTAMAKTLQLNNVYTEQIRAEDLTQKFDFVIGRAVTVLPTFLAWVTKNLHVGHKSSLPNGVLYLKGDDYKKELSATLMKPTNIFPLETYFKGEFYQSKYLLHFSTESLKKLKLRYSPRL